jgi:hypothetical protein
LVTRTAYQTLENKENRDFVERCGPFPCNRKNAWLGTGYYFWDSFIENAHWWGKDGANYSNGYFICKALFDLNELCFNLIDNHDHLKMFNDSKQLMTEQKLYIQNQTTVARIIEHLKSTLKIFNYEAVRAYGINSLAYNSTFSNRTIFDARHNTKYLDSTPAIQICFYTKESLNLRNYTLIYPPEYTDDYLV